MVDSVSINIEWKLNLNNSWANYSSTIIPVNTSSDIQAIAVEWTDEQNCMLERFDKPAETYCLKVTEVESGKDLVSELCKSPASRDEFNHNVETDSFAIVPGCSYHAEMIVQRFFTDNREQRTEPKISQGRIYARKATIFVSFLQFSNLVIYRTNVNRPIHGETVRQ